MQFRCCALTRRRMTRDAAVFYQRLHSVLSGRVCTYACTPGGSTEMRQLHSVSLGEHVKNRQAVQSRLRRAALGCLHATPCSAEIYCTCRCNLNLPRDLFLSAYSSIVRIFAFGNYHFVCFARFANVLSTESFQPCKLVIEIRLGETASDTGKTVIETC